MAKVKRTKAEKLVRKRKVRKDRIKIELPTEYEIPINDINEYSFLLHGQKKIGKTSTSIQGCRSLLIQNDPAQKAYKRLEIVVPDWLTFKAALKKLEELGTSIKDLYDRIVLDGADIWYQKCLEYVCSKLGIEHPQDEGWGKGWNEVRREFSSGVHRLLNLPLGVWFISHSGWREVETHDGKKIDRLLPKLTGQAEEVLNGLVDGWFAYDYIGKHRVLFLQGNENIGAGHRLNSKDNPHFVDVNGDPLEYIRMGTSPEQGYENFVDAFNNRYVPIKPSEKRKGIKVKTKKRKR